jgi:hypothetical protein
MKKLLVVSLAILFVLTMSSGVLAFWDWGGNNDDPEPCYDFECVGENAAELFQDGKYNEANIEQMGQAQYALVEQEGVFHVADVMQYGTKNTTVIRQKGEQTCIYSATAELTMPLLYREQTIIMH